jgi:hypothetical protein
MNDDIFNVVVNPDGVWDYSRFPHPLITIDYDRNDKPIQVVAIGPIARRMKERVDALIAEVSA